jgi:threonine dehydratase
MLQPNKYRELQATHPDLSSFIGDSELYDTHEYLNHKNRLYISDQGVRPARSFKIAGVANQVLEAYDDGADSFTIASAGSAAMALGNTLRRLDRNSTANIFLPRASSSQKIKHIYNEHPDGVIIKNDFDTFDDARLAATQHAAQTGAHLIEPFNSRSMIAGNVAIVRDAVDKLRDREDRNLVLSMAIGGAGLIAAASIVASQQPGIRLVAAQYASNNSLSRSLQAQKVTAIDQPDSLCAG